MIFFEHLKKDSKKENEETRKNKDQQFYLSFYVKSVATTVIVLKNSLSRKKTLLKHKSVISQLLPFI